MELCEKVGGNGEVIILALRRSEGGTGHRRHRGGAEFGIFIFSRVKPISRGNVRIEHFEVVVSSVTVTDAAVVGDDENECVIKSSGLFGRLENSSGNSSEKSYGTG